MELYIKIRWHTEKTPHTLHDGPQRETVAVIKPRKAAVMSKYGLTKLLTAPLLH